MELIPKTKSLKDKVRDFLKPRKKLILRALAAVIIIEVLAIFLYFYPKSKSQNTANFSLNKVRIVQKGDFLVGKNLPDSKIVLAFSKDITFSVNSNSDGVWSYKIPSDLEGRYNLIVRVKDQKNRTLQYRSHKIRVVENREVYKLQKKVTGVLNL